MSIIRNNWTKEEDQIISKFVLDLNLKKWTKIAKAIQDELGVEGRTGKQCRERWHNHLNPDIKKEEWTAEEERTVFDLQKQFGNKWSEIASMMPGRTDNSIKNCFYSAIRRNLRRYNKKRPDNEKLKGSVKSLLKKPHARAILMNDSGDSYTGDLKNTVSPIVIVTNADIDNKPSDIACPSVSPWTGIGFTLTPIITNNMLASSYAPGFYDFSERLDELKVGGLYLDDGNSPLDFLKSECGTPNYILNSISPNASIQYCNSPRSSY